MKTYRVGIIGLGNIAAMYAKPDDPRPYCHAGGIRHSDRVELTAVCDLSEEVRERFCTAWGSAFSEGLTYHDSIEDMFRENELDIIGVCVRGPHHFPVMMEVLAHRPPAIFLEKPPSCSLEEMDTYMAVARAEGVPVMVDYSRHWSPKVLRMQELVQQGLIGEVKTVVAYCGGTFLSFASHTTDLICQFAGYCPARVLAHGQSNAGAEVPEGYEPEPSIDNMAIDFENGVIGLQVGTRGPSGTFYCEAFGTDGTVRAGIYTQVYAEDKDGKAIEPEKLELPEEVSVFKVAYEQMADHLDGGPIPDCTNDDFIAVNEIGFAAIESTLTGKRIDLPNSNRGRRIFANG